MVKSLCVCAGGRVRSVAARFILTDYYRHDALAVGLDKNNILTVNMLCDWADNIFVLDAALMPVLKEALYDESNDSKIKLIDVGPDVWGSESSRHLRELVAVRLSDAIGFPPYRP